MTRAMVCVRSIRWAWLGLIGTVAFAPVRAAEGTPPSPAASEEDGLYSLGRQLFEQYAPPEMKAEYEFPTREQWNAFLPKLQAGLDAGSLAELAAYAPQARAVLTALRAAGTDEDLASWLEQRLDELEAAREAKEQPSPTPRPAPPVAPLPKTPAPPKPAAPLAARVPYYELWYARIRERPVPVRAGELMPVLRQAFAAEGVPPALAWLAEAESSLNPAARSPAGAKGLFQLMPDTAKRLGLDTFLPDERTNPEKSARAAARYLRELRGRFGDWPLALAAYNAGEGRIARALTNRKAKDFAAIADALPAETRMYVPKVCALVAIRSGTPIASL